jgi:Family of unknown function (DUF5678)
MSAPTEDNLRHQLGGEPENIARELRDFTDAAKVLSSSHPRLIDAYPMQWVAVYGGRVVAHSTDMADVLKRIQDQDIPLSSAIIRFIEKDEPALVL